MQINKKIAAKPSVGVSGGQFKELDLLYIEYIMMSPP